MPFEIFSILNLLFGAFAAVSLMYHSPKAIKTSRRVVYALLGVCAGAISVAYALVLLDLMSITFLPYVLRPTLTVLLIPLMILPLTGGDREMRHRIEALEDRAKQNDQIIERLLQSMSNKVQDDVADIIDIEKPPQTPLLLICGDTEFCEADTDRLNQAGIAYRILRHATKADVAEELQRRRLDGSLYWWVHVSAHGSAEGIMLADGLADARFWNRHLSGVRIVFLAACDGPEVGDLLVGVARRVVVFYGDIKSETAALFTLSFWRARNRSLSPDESYDQATREVPAARAYVDLRRN